MIEESWSLKQLLEFIKYCKERGKNDTERVKEYDVFVSIYIVSEF